MSNSNLQQYLKWYKKLKKEKIYKKWIITIIDYMIFIKPELINIPILILRPQAKELAKSHLIKLDYRLIKNITDIEKYIINFIIELNKAMGVDINV